MDSSCICLPVYQDWLDFFESPHTRATYGDHLTKLLSLMTLTPEQCLESGRMDVNGLWTRAKVTSQPAFKPKGREAALNGLRNFLRFNGIYPPHDRVKRGRVQKPMNRLTWPQALEICQAASPPYRFIFKLMLHCGWGIGEFFQFNSARNWESVRAWHQTEPTAPYYRIDFPDRKSNGQPSYSLIPHNVIQEIIDSGVKTPFLTYDGKYPGRVLNAENYHNSEVCLNSAFKRALKRTKIKVEGSLSPHDYRDCFKTECTLRNLPYEVGEFALHHTVDQRGYEKCYRDVPWLWSQVSRLFDTAGPQNQQLEQELAALKKDLAGKVTREELVGTYNMTVEASKASEEVMQRTTQLLAKYAEKEAEVTRLKQQLAASTGVAAGPRLLRASRHRRKGSGAR